MDAQLDAAIAGRLNPPIANWMTRVNLVRVLLICAILAAAATLGSRLMAPVTLAFPDFPAGVATIDLGQALTIQVDAQNDGGKGVTWTCAGDACTKLTSTTKWATFYASGITGTATITATSIEHPSVHKSLTVAVYLNAAPDMLCDGNLLPPEPMDFS